MDPKSVLSSLSSIPQLKTTLASAQDAINQGESLYSGASDAAGGDYAGLAVAAQGLISDLPPGRIANGLHDAMDIVSVEVAGASGAAAGAGAVTAIGFPELAPIAAEVGAVVGAGVAFISEVWPMLKQDHFNVFKLAGQIVSAVWNEVNFLGIGDHDPAQPDYRYLAEKSLFPGVPNSPSAYAVVPGEMRWNPRCEPTLNFYQTFAGPNSIQGSPQYSFLVTWRGLKNETHSLQYQAWILVQYYTQAFSKRLGRPLKGAISWNTVVQVLGGEKKAHAALDKLQKWYGTASEFSVTLPFAGTKGHPSNIANTPANVQATIDEFERHPLDFLYYPIPTRYDRNQKIMLPTNRVGETDVMVTPDVFIFVLAEAAIEGKGDVTAFHLALQFQHIFVISRKEDAKLFAGLSVRPHPNFSRVIGRLSAQIRKDAAKTKVAAPVSKTPAKAATNNATKAGPAAHSLPSKYPHKSHYEVGAPNPFSTSENAAKTTQNSLQTTSSSGILLLAGLGIVTAYLLSRKRSS